MHWSLYCDFEYLLQAKMLENVLFVLSLSLFLHKLCHFRASTIFQLVVPLLAFFANARFFCLSVDPSPPLWWQILSSRGSCSFPSGRHSNGTRCFTLSPPKVDKVKKLFNKISKFHFVKYWKTKSTAWTYCWRGFTWMVTSYGFIHRLKS